jgi:hypothetical protein
MDRQGAVMTGKQLISLALLVCVLGFPGWASSSRAGELNTKTDFIEFNSETNTALWPGKQVLKSVDLLPNGIGNLNPAHQTLRSPSDIFWNWADDAGINFKTGVGYLGTFAGDVRMTATFKDVTSGAVDVTYPVNVSLAWPEPNTFAAGDTVAITKSFSLMTEGADAASMTVTPPQSNVQFSGKLYLDIDLTFDVCILGNCNIMGGSIPSINFSTAAIDPSALNVGVTKDGNYLSFNLFQLNAGEDKIFSPNSSTPISFLEKDLPYTFTPQDGMTLGLRCLNPDRTEVPPSTQACVDVPLVAMRHDDLQVIDGYKLSYLNQEDLFVSIQADLDRYLSSKLLTNTPALGVTATIPGTGGKGYIQAEGVAIDLNNQLTQKMSLEFAPALWLDLDFAAEIPNIGAETSIEVTTQSNEFNFVFPEQQKDPLVVGLNYRLENTLTARNELKKWSQLKERVLDVGFSIPELKFDAKRWECPSWLGPLCKAGEMILNVFTKTFTGKSWNPPPLIQATLAPSPNPEAVSLFDTNSLSWSLGFPAAPRTAITLNPENPSMTLVHELSRLRNNGRSASGEMSRTLTFAIEIANTGDVPLKEVQIQDLLNETFPAASVHGYRIDLLNNCDTADFPETVPVNLSYDGSPANAQLLDASRLNRELQDWENTALDVREASVALEDDGRETDYLPVLVHRPTQSLVVLQATVNPKPYPPEFTSRVSAQGSSWVVGTPVAASHAAAFDLGPGKISGLQDFVLFADKKIVIDEMADSQGHIGTRGDIEIHQGDAHTLAGDMHALGRVDIHGQIVSDYLFAGQWVNITGNGSLNGKTEADLQGMAEVNQYHDQSLLSGFVIDLPEVAATGPDVLIAANNSAGNLGPQKLAPGSYGEVEVAAGATLEMTGKSGGVYNLAGLLLRRGSRIFFNLSDGPITLNIEKPLEIAEDVRMSRLLDEDSGRYATTRDIVFNVQEEGHINVGARARVMGVIKAPHAKVTFNAGSSLQGAAYAEFIDVKSNASFQYHDDWYGTLFPGIDSDCNGTPDYLQGLRNASPAQKTGKH